MRQTKNGNTRYRRLMRCSKSHSQKEVHSDKCLYQETREISNNYTSLKARKRTNEAQS